MADPQAALLTQLRNIEAKTGRRITDLQAAPGTCGLAKFGERRSWLMSQFKLGHGDANTVLQMVGKLPADFDHESSRVVATAATADVDPLDAIYAGPKAALRSVHDAVLAAVSAFGPFEVAPKKAYLSLRRQKQFAMIGPATRDLVEVGLNCKDLPAHPRLKLQPAGSMCQATTRIASAAEVDAQLIAWLRSAYDAAA